jgi:hypothetical protein
MICAISSSAVNLFVLFSSASYSILIFLNGFALLWLALDVYCSKRSIHPVLRIITASAIMIGVLVSLPITGIQTSAADAPIKFEVAGKHGEILAPNITERNTNIMDILYTMKNNETTQVTGSTVNNLPLGEEIFKEFFDPLFNIPEDFYKNSLHVFPEYHSLMKTLALWNEQFEEDVTQVKIIMGFGEVALDGSIRMSGDIKALTRSAIQSNPDAFIIPMEAFDEVKRLAPNLIVVPVTHFVEVLYFLSQPVMFWSVSYALFCH